MRHTWSLLYMGAVFGGGVGGAFVAWSVLLLNGIYGVESVRYWWPIMLFSGMIIGAIVGILMTFLQSRTRIDWTAVMSALGVGNLSLLLFVFIAAPLLVNGGVMTEFHARIIIPMSFPIGAAAFTFGTRRSRVRAEQCPC